MNGTDPRRNGGNRNNRGRPANGAPRRQPYGQSPPPDRGQRRQQPGRRSAGVKRPRRKGHPYLGRFLVFLVVLLLLLLAVGGVFWFVFHRTPHADPDSGRFTYYYGGRPVREAAAEDCVADGVAYLCFNDLSDYLGMAESGSAAEGLSFLLPVDDGGETDSGGTGREEYVVFRTGEGTAEVNGQLVSTDGTNRIVGEEMWIGVDFVTEYMQGLSVTLDEGKREIRVSRLVDEAMSTEEVTSYLPVSFRLKPEVTLETIPQPETDGETGDGGAAAPAYELNFVNDLTEYEKYMDPEDRDGYLTLVNTVNLLDRSYTPSDLVDCRYTGTGRTTQQLRLYANKALEALMMEMQSAGYYGMMVLSGFRSYDKQAYLFNQYTANELAANPNLTTEQAEQIVLTYSTRPGTSEHQTGLAVDMDTLGTFTTDFEYEPEYAWLQENAWKFGFILRFPKDKTDITTIQFEPWHYRYVGRYHAKKIHDLGVCLEEYVELWKNGQIS